MTIEVGKSGGVFVPTFERGADAVLSGASGVLVTITPPTDERVRLDSLNSLGAENKLTLIKADGITIIAGELNNTPSNGQPAENRFCIRNVGAQDLSNAAQATGVKEPMVFMPNAVVTIEIDIALTSDMNYSYSFGVLK